MVKITYKGETRNIPPTYLKGLKGAERQKQIKSIFEGKMRPCPCPYAQSLAAVRRSCRRCHGRCRSHAQI